MICSIKCNLPSSFNGKTRHSSKIISMKWEKSTGYFKRFVFFSLEKSKHKKFLVKASIKNNICASIAYYYCEQIMQKL